MPKKINKIAGWSLTILLALLFSMSIFLKLSYNEAALAQAASIGFDAQTYWFIGVIELLSLILFVIPRTGIIGSLLLIAYMGGAIASHLQHQQSITMAVGVQLLIWITFVLRYPQVLQLVFPSAQKLVKQQ